jgi:ATP-binding cassette subfamily C (CFTR/MRP) protein 4
MLKLPTDVFQSSLLHAIMKELPVYSGSVSTGGSISYASQEPWLFVGTVRQNILFGQPYIAEKYKEVVKVCALQKDFDMFRHGDRTMVGEKGISLSGGQRARINLAR